MEMINIIYDESRKEWFMYGKCKASDFQRKGKPITSRADINDGVHCPSFFSQFGIDEVF